MRRRGVVTGAPGTFHDPARNSNEDGGADQGHGLVIVKVMVPVAMVIWWW